MAGVISTGAACWPQLCAALPTVRHVIVHRNLGLDAADTPARGDAIDFSTTIARDDALTTASAAALAALRPPAVDRLLQWHHRSAKTHRAWAWRHHARIAEADHAAQQRRPQRGRRRLASMFLLRSGP